MAKSLQTLKILVVHTSNMNFGDTVLADNDIYLLEKSLKKRKIPYKLFVNSISSRDISQVRYVDALVFAGGILKETNEKFWQYIPELITEANEYNVPVFLSAIGAEPKLPDSEINASIRAALNLPVVKGISIRDDIDTLLRDYVENSEIRVKPVLDPAIWCKDCYKDILPAKLNIKKNEIIGLGIVRYKLFEDYGNPQIDKDFQLKYWQEVIERLEANNLKWVLFTNGDTYDERFANELLGTVGHGEKLPAPRDAKELVRYISGFRGVIAGRMHSNIIAYSLGIPSIGFIWNQKLRFWGEKIGHPERFLEIDELTAENSVERLMKALKENVKPGYFKKRGVFKELDWFVVNHLIDKPKHSESVKYAEKLIAPNMGTIEKRYKNSNSPEAFKYSAEHGFKSFELSLRLSADDELVCVNGWNHDTYHILNNPLSEEEEKQPLSVEQFTSLKLYNRFTTSTFEGMLRSIKPSFKDSFILFLSIGRPPLEKLDFFLGKMKEAFINTGFDESKVIVRFETKDSVKLFLNKDFKAKADYHFTTSKDDKDQIMKLLKEKVEFCQKNDVEYISMREGLFTDFTAEYIKENNLKPLVFSYVKLDRINEAIKLGAWKVGSLTYDVEYLNELTKKN